jgi:hypothetical protein
VNANIGLLMAGPLNRAEDIVSGFGVGGTLRKQVGAGYQISSSSSMTLLAVFALLTIMSAYL